MNHAKDLDDDKKSEKSKRDRSKKIIKKPVNKERKKMLPYKKTPKRDIYNYLEEE